MFDEVTARIAGRFARPETALLPTTSHPAHIRSAGACASSLIQRDTDHDLIEEWHMRCKQAEKHGGNMSSLRNKR